jgi:hypothetical protein
MSECILISLSVFCWEQTDESFVLPVLLRFDGHPEVDDKVCACCLPFLVGSFLHLHSCSLFAGPKFVDTRVLWAFIAAEVCRLESFVLWLRWGGGQLSFSRETFSTAFHHCRGQLWIGLVGEKQLLVKDYQMYTFLKANGTSGTQSYAWSLTDRIDHIHV